MDTSKSLLFRAKGDRNSEAWLRLISIYDPLISGWLRRGGVETRDVSDVSQDVFCKVSSELQNFDHYGRVGSFRNWLKKITINCCRRYWEDKNRQVPTTKSLHLDPEFNLLNELEDPKSELSQLWDQEHDRYVFDRILQLIKNEFEERTLDVFVRNIVKGESPKDISDDLGISTGLVYKLKFRVMQRLREEAAGLIDDFDQKV